MAGLGPRAAIVSRWVDPGTGTGRTIFEHARRLAALGWQVDVWCEKGVSPEGARLRRLAGWPWGSYFKRWLFAARAGRGTATGYDLVHGHGDEFSCDVLSLHNCVHAAHLAVHGYPLPSSSGVGRLHERILREGRFKRVIANSKLMKDELIARYALPPEAVEVVYPGYDPAKFNVPGKENLRLRARRELGFSDADVVFGLITSGDFVKRGVGVFISALGRLARDGREFKAIVVGKEARLAPYRAAAAEAGLGGRLLFLPPVPDVERYYHAIDVYVHPALYEEFGQSVQEALACGLPVVCGPQVGAAELLSGDARAGVLDRVDEETLAAKLAEFLDPARRRTLGALGVAVIAGRGWERNFQETCAVYRNLGLL